MKAKAAPLLVESCDVIPLYDPAAMLQIEAEKAYGFAVLLGGSPAHRRQSLLDDSVVALGFQALTEGNTVDACFGVSQANSPGRKMVTEAKTALSEAAFKNEDFPRIAVDAYREAFAIVIDYRVQLSQLNCFTACFRQRGIQKRALKALDASFVHLREVMSTAIYGSLPSPK